MRESTESLSASSLILLLHVLRQLFESLCFIANPVLFRRSGSTPFCIALCAQVSIVLLTQYALVIASRSPHNKPHEHGRTACAYEGVNGVNISFSVSFCFRFFSSFLSTSASSLIQYFSIALNLHHLLQTPDRPLDPVRSRNPLAFAA